MRLSLSLSFFLSAAAQQGLCNKVTMEHTHRLVKKFFVPFCVLCFLLIYVYNFSFMWWPVFHCVCPLEMCSLSRVRSFNNAKCLPTFCVVLPAAATIQGKTRKEPFPQAQHFLSIRTTHNSANSAARAAVRCCARRPLKLINLKSKNYCYRTLRGE